MNINKLESDGDFVHITLRLSKGVNEKLTKAASASFRTKRKEAELRLAIHLEEHDFVADLKGARK